MGAISRPLKREKIYENRAAKIITGRQRCILADWGWELINILYNIYLNNNWRKRHGMPIYEYESFNYTSIGNCNFDVM